jgi:hypothetical protein
MADLPLRPSAPPWAGLRVALVHDWLTGMRGGEKVLESICRLFPGADLLTLVHKKGSASAAIVDGRAIRTSLVQRLPGATRWYRQYLPLFPRRRLAACAPPPTHARRTRQLSPTSPVVCPKESGPPSLPMTTPEQDCREMR